MKAMTKRDPDSVFVEHINERHNGEFGNGVCCGFKMSVRETHCNAMDRQITEATKIDMSLKPTMNRKTGYRSNSVLRLRSSLTAENNTPVMP